MINDNSFGSDRFFNKNRTPAEQKRLDRINAKARHTCMTCGVRLLPKGANVLEPCSRCKRKVQS